jgi:hypothetical protein
MMHILNSKNSQPLDKNLNLAMPTFGPTTREYYTFRMALPTYGWFIIPMHQTRLCAATFQG